MLVPAPEPTSRVPLAESGMFLEHLSQTVGFEHGLGGLDGAILGDVDREMHVTSAEAEVAEVKPESFEIPERLGAGVDMRLFFKTHIVAFGLEHHGDPVVSCVSQWLFIASAIFILHSNEFLLSHLYRAGERLPRVTKNRYGVMEEKRRCDFSSAGLSLRFGPRGIPSRS